MNTKVFFAPSEGGNTIHVFYPQILKNGTPDGRLWLRNVKCGTPEANGNPTRATASEPNPDSVKVVTGGDDGGVDPKVVGIFDLDFAVKAGLVNVLVDGEFAVFPGERLAFFCL